MLGRQEQAPLPCGRAHASVGTTSRLLSNRTHDLGANSPRLTCRYEMSSDGTQALRGFSISNVRLGPRRPVSPAAVCHRLQAALECFTPALRFAPGNAAIVFFSRK